MKLEKLLKRIAFRVVKTGQIIVNFFIKSSLLLSPTKLANGISTVIIFWEIEEYKMYNKALIVPYLFTSKKVTFFQLMIRKLALV